MQWWRLVVCVVVALGTAASGVAWASSDPSMTSSNYSVTESQVGGNGDFNEGSSSYSLAPNIDDGGSSLGEATVGNSSSTNYQSNAGFNTTAQPGLILTVNTSGAALGLLSSGSSTYATATFDVRNYTSYGYVVSLDGATPANAGHNLTALTTDTSPSPGTEQFGINTVHNTSAGQGADPVQLPNSSFAFGVAGDGATGTYGSTRPYTISDKFRYISGETIASAPKSSGDTQYTVTFMANESNVTPGGAYNGDMAIVVTGTY